MKYAAFVAITAMLLQACAAKEDAPAIAPTGGTAIIGHGGMGNPGINNPYQLNSFIGMKNALDVYRLDGVETDIQLTRDSTLFMIHDDYLELLTYCSGCIFNADSAFMSSCGFRPVSSGQFRNDPVTPLESLFAVIASRRNSARVFLDIHAPATCIPDEAERKSHYGRMMRSLKRLLDRYPVANRIAIQATDREILLQAEAIVPQVKLYLDYCESMEDVEYAKSRGYAGVAAQTGSFSAELVAAAHAAGLKVQLYDAASQRDIIDAMKKSPDYFLADNLVLTQQIAEVMNGQ